jgi:hypothetical protein
MAVLAENGLKGPQDFFYLDSDVIREMKHLSPITKAKLRTLVTHLGVQAAPSAPAHPGEYSEISYFPTDNKFESRLSQEMWRVLQASD